MIRKGRRGPYSSTGSVRSYNSYNSYSSGKRSYGSNMSSSSKGKSNYSYNSYKLRWFALFRIKYKLYNKWALLKKIENKSLKIRKKKGKEKANQKKKKKIQMPWLRRINWCISKFYHQLIGWIRKFKRLKIKFLKRKRLPLKERMWMK